MASRGDLILVGWDPDLLELVRGRRVRGYVAPESSNGVPFKYLGDDSKLADLIEHGAFLLVMDRPSIKTALTEVLGAGEFATLESLHAFVCETARVGTGSIIQRWAYVGSGSRVGAHTKLNVGAAIHHDVVVGDYCTIAPGARLLGGAQVGSGTFIGAGAIILPRIRVSEGAVVGAGAVVTAHVGPGQVVKGVPAR